MLVSSSNIREVVFTPNFDSRGELTIVFHSGATYVYREVPAKLYNQFVVADSKGKFFSQNIKHAFKYEKIADDKFTALVEESPVLEQFGSLLKILVSKNIASLERDTSGDLRITISHMYVKDLK